SAVISSTLFGSTTGEAGLGLVQESLVADLEILGAEAGEALVVLLRRQRGRVQQTPGELLVPTSHQRRPLRDPARGGKAFGRDLAVFHNAVDQSHAQCFFGVENVAF